MSYLGEFFAEMKDQTNNLITLTEEVDELKAELADLRRKLRAESTVNDALGVQINRLHSELSDLRASSVVVRVLCETCGGDGVLRESDNATFEEWISCPDCVDGWRLAEGVRHSNWAGGYVIPARLIEGDT